MENFSKNTVYRKVDTSIGNLLTPNILQVQNNILLKSLSVYEDEIIADVNLESKLIYVGLDSHLETRIRQETWKERNNSPVVYDFMKHYAIKVRCGIPQTYSAGDGIY